PVWMKVRCTERLTSNEPGQLLKTPATPGPEKGTDAAKDETPPTHCKPPGDWSWGSRLVGLVAALGVFRLGKAPARQMGRQRQGVGGDEHPDEHPPGARGSWWARFHHHHLYGPCRVQARWDLHLEGAAPGRRHRYELLGSQGGRFPCSLGSRWGAGKQADGPNPQRGAGLRFPRRG